MNNNPIALMVNSAMHGAFLCDPSFDQLGGDITCMISAYVETYGKHQYPVLWVTGGGGDQNLAIQTMEAITEYTDVFSFWGGETAFCVDSKIPATDHLDNNDNISKAESLRIRLHLCTIEKIAFVGINGEITARHCQQIRKILSDKTVFFLDMCYGHAGCIPDPESVKMNGYVAKRTYCQSAEDVTQRLCNESPGRLDISGCPGLFAVMTLSIVASVTG